MKINWLRLLRILKFLKSIRNILFNKKMLGLAGRTILWTSSLTVACIYDFVRRYKKK